jgi:formate dehydrogenase major subunit/NADH-quinone oxidoreductase subunit G
MPGERVMLLIDGREVVARRGERLLWAALDVGIEIPNLCARRDREPPFGACRLCAVEIEGWRSPVMSCAVSAADGMVVKTRTPMVDRLVASAFELLMSHHNLECRRCAANKRCGLQRIALARKLKLKPRRIPRLERRSKVDESHPALRFDRSKCVLCGQCVWVCQRDGAGVLDFVRRGLAIEVSTSGDVPLIETSCDGCQACAQACPTGALTARSQTREDGLIFEEAPQ